MEKLRDLNMKYNPVVRNHEYYPKIEEKVLNLQVLDDEQIGEDRGAFFSQKLALQQERYDTDGKVSKVDQSTQEYYERSLNKIVNKFASIGFNIDIDKQGIDGTKVSNKIADEPLEEDLIVAQVRTQKKEQKAEQSYEQNMQGFGETFSTSFYNTSTSGFGGGFVSHPGRPQSAYQRAGTVTEKRNTALTDFGSDDEFENQK